MDHVVDDINDTFGAMLVGAFVTMAVFGITTLQTYFYYIYYPKDGLGNKILVAAIWVLDATHVVFMCHAVYYYLIHTYHRPQLHGTGVWSLFASLGMNVLIAFAVQCFFTLHIRKLCPPKIRFTMTCVISFFVFAHFVFGIETVAFMFVKREFSRLPEMQYQSAMPFAIAAILSDVAIAVALCWLLGTNKSDFSDTNNVINKLIVLAVNRCILTSAVAVVEVVVFVLLPKSFYSFGMDFLIGKLYANSLLASLNSRRSLLAASSVRSEGTRTDPSLSFNTRSAESGGEYRPTDFIQVRGIDAAHRHRSSDNESKQIATNSSTQPSGRSMKGLV